MAVFVPSPGCSSWHFRGPGSSVPSSPRSRCDGKMGVAGLGMVALLRGSWKKGSWKGWKLKKLKKLGVALRAEVEMELPDLDLDPKALDSAPELTFMIEELPARNSSSLIVQHRLGSETQIPAVLKLVATQFDQVHPG